MSRSRLNLYKHEKAAPLSDNLFDNETPLDGCEKYDIYDAWFNLQLSYKDGSYEKYVLNPKKEKTTNPLYSHVAYIGGKH